ncbi:MAG: PAS-domain containing protein [Aquisalinus sp.]|nr:PAS-domain containing protein [Aquisalinus sp.]
MPVLPIMAALGIYFLAMFAVAWLGDRKKLRLGLINAAGPKSTLIIYSLSLAVYCTSWTFYGAVGTAASSGWEYLPIYLGPIIIFTIGRPLVRKLVTVGKQQNTTSIADFLSARYGRSRSLATLVTLIATFGAIPYFALQLRSVTFTLESITDTFAFGLTAELFSIASMLALFAIFFGTRHLDVTQHNRGMIAAIALDSLIKLLALLAVGCLALILVSDEAHNTVQLQENPFAAPLMTDRFLTLTVLSMAAVLCLPRQFHVMIVECQDEKSIGKAGLGFVSYLIIVSLLVIPITLAGLKTPATSIENPDLFVLALPASQGNDFLTLITFIGGFAAATAMIIVGGVALSTMITNDLLVPAYMNLQRGTNRDQADISRTILTMRRVTIAVLLLSAASFAAYVPPNLNLASLGIISFAAAAQFSPALIGGLYWRHGTRMGANIGLLTGFTIWLTALLIPSLLQQPSFAGDIMPFGWDDLTNGTLLSLIANTGLYIIISKFSTLTVGEKVQASYFLKGGKLQKEISEELVPDYNLTAGDVRIILEKFLGPEQAEKSLEAYRVLTNKAFLEEDLIDADFIRFAEKQIARTLGSSSARILLTRTLTGKGLGVEDVVTLLDETSQILSFNQDLLQTTLENIPQGVSVIDRDLKLVAWNTAYLQIYDFPEGFVHADKPVQEILKFNADRGEFGRGNAQQQIEKRLSHLRAGTPHTYERQRLNGTVIKIQGKPIPGGGYVTTFTDITEYKNIESALRNSEESIRFYTDNIPFPVAYTDINEVILFSNAAYRKMFGQNAMRLRGKTLLSILSDEEYALRIPYIRQVITGQRVSFDIEKEHDGEIRTMQVTYIPQYTDEKDIVGFFGLYQDITDRRAAEQALQNTNETLEERVQLRTRELESLNEALDLARQEAIVATKSKTRFLAAASHDVLQPLNAARLFNSALINDLEAAGQNTDLARKIEQSITSADLLLKTLLNISKLDAGGVIPSKTTFSLNDLLEELVDEFRVIASEKKLFLRSVKASIAVSTDRGLLRSVLQNLISNAIRYTNEGGVLIGCRRKNDDTVQIQVCDTGAGIPESKHKDIFREFIRLQNDTHTQGVGLGLATVERICRLLNHSIDVSSKPGSGSIFSITLASAGREETTKAAAQTTTSTLSKMTVLCVDNDAQVLEAMAALLKRWGVEAKLAHNLDEVISYYPAGAEAPDVLLLDYRLDNDETGIDVMDYFSAITSQPPSAALLTGEESSFVEQKAAKYGIPVLAKPVEPAVLRAFLLRQHTLAAE